MSMYSLDDRHDTGEWTPPECDGCGDGPAVMERDGDALCGACAALCSACWVEAWVVTQPGGSVLCGACAADEDDARREDRYHDLREADAVSAGARR